MIRTATSLLIVLASGTALAAAAPPATRPTAPPATKPALKITPGQVIVPFDNMRRPWGELISVDLTTRSGKFRRDGTDEVMSFVVMPYAEMLHHATFGDLDDFRVGERVIFRLHPNDSGEWVWLTYIQDEMNMMLGHKEFYYVDSIDNEHHSLTVTQANQDKSFVREKGIVIDTDKDTRFWKEARQVRFEDIKIGNALRTKTHGVGKGKTRVAWEVFLDEASLLKFQAEQKEIHAARMLKEGLPCYVDATDGKELKLTVFQEGLDLASTLKKASRVQVAPAGVDRKPTKRAIEATVASATKAGKLCKVVVTVPATQDFQPGQVARVWVPPVDSRKVAK